MAPSLTQLLIVLAIVVLLFGTKKLRNIGGDLGSAIRNFKSSVKEGEEDADRHVEQLKSETTAAEDKPQSKTRS